MITILIAQDEKKVQQILTEMFKKEGYVVPEKWDESNIIRIIKKESIKDISSLRDTVIELEDSLYKEKEGVLYKSILEHIEKPLIEQALERSEGNQLKAARVLGINRNTLRAKIKKLGIDVSRWKD